MTTLGWALVGAATGALALAAGPAQAQDTQLSGEITVWSWDVAARALEGVVPAFNERYPNVTVRVEDVGNHPTYDRGLAGCAAGGTGMPDVYTMENQEAEVFWARFPDCFHDLKSLSADEGELLERFPDFKLTELTVGDAVYAMPWDSGPVVFFYRRDLFDRAGVDVATIETWDDFIAAGQDVVEANGEGTRLVSTNRDTTWFRMLASQAGCVLFDETGKNVTINQPGCVQALETVGRINEAGLFLQANWGETLQAIGADRLAGSVYGAWYEGSLRGAVPEQSGQWGIVRMPTFETGGTRAANLGGSALAIPSASQNPEAALAFLNFALGTPEGQIIQLRESGLVPTLPEALNHPYVREPQPFWGGEPVWETILGTLGDISPWRGTQFFAEADSLFVPIFAEFMGGGVEATEALDRAAAEISDATGLPVKE